MRRRALLATLGSATAVGLAGCTDVLPLSNGGGDSLPAQSDEPEGWPVSTNTSAVETVVGYRDIDPADAEVFLEPSAQSVTDGSSIEFTFRNIGDEDFVTNFYGWDLHKWVDDEWFYVGPKFKPIPAMIVAPGNAHTWTLTVDNTGIEDGKSVPHVEGTADLTFAGLGGGHYAFGIDGWFESGSYETQTVCFARFELAADAIQLTPSNAVEETTREGETLVATTDRGDPEEGQFAAYELAHVAEPSVEPTEIITEQVFWNDQLRDALALAREHDADRVTLKEYTSTQPLFSVDGSERYRYQGSTYEVTARELEG